MGRGAEPAGVLLLLLWPWGCSGVSAAPATSSTRARAPHLHSLRVNITVTPTPGPQPPWCEAEVEVQGEPCFSYDCRSHEVTPVCVRGMKVAAALREELREILEDLTAKFKEKLLDVEPEDPRGSAPLSLQATLEIQEEAGGRYRGSWQLVFSGRVSLLLDLETRAWTVAHPGDRWMLDKWAEDRDMDTFLWRTSPGAWRTWLQEVAAHWGPRGTTAPPSTTPDTPPDTSGAESAMQGFLLNSMTLLAGAILHGFRTRKGGSTENQQKQN